MKARKNSKIISISVIGLLLALGACGKKPSDYGDITPVNTITKLPDLTYDSNDINNDPSVLDVSNSNDQLLLQQNLEDLLDRFYQIAVKVENGHSFVTKVNYEGLYELRNQLDLKYMKLVEAIRQKIENPTALDGKSQRYYKAFLINAYNFNIIQIIVRNLIKNEKKIESIRDIRNRLDLDQNSIFKQKGLLKIAGHLLSFEELETRIVNLPPLNVPDIKDARVIFALSKGCNTCAILLDEAYRETKLEEQLNEMTRLSIRRPTIITNDSVHKITHLNQLFKWNKSIFDQTKIGGIPLFVQTYGTTRIYSNTEYLPFDWNLNQVSEPTPINIGDIPIITAPTENPCLTFIQQTNFTSLASCQKVIKGQTSDSYKYTAEVAHLCLLSKIDHNKQTTLRLVGNLKEFDDNQNAQPIVRVDISTTKYVSDAQTEILSFTHKGREISQVEYNVKTMELKFSQKFRFWSLDIFKAKKQRSFILSCLATK